MQYRADGGEQTITGYEADKWIDIGPVQQRTPRYCSTKTVLKPSSISPILSLIYYCVNQLQHTHIHTQFV